MKNLYLLLFPLLLGLISCSDDEVNNDPEQTVFYYAYIDKYELTEANRYIGPTGAKIQTTESYFDKLWDWRKPMRNNIIIDTEQSLVFMKDEFSTLQFELALTIKGDDVYVTSKNDFTSYLGRFNTDKSAFTQYHTYYIRRFDKRDDTIYGSYVFHKGNDYGIGKYEDHFYENGFHSPDSMDMEYDEIMWINVTYEFEAIK